MIKLAIYDMDRTITRHGTYTPSLLYAARRLAPWRLVSLPLVPLTMLLYAAKLINRATLKEWNQRLLLGPHLNPAELKRRSEEHTSELQSLMRISYAVFCLKKKKRHKRR